MFKVQDAKAHVETKNNITKTWKIILDKATVDERNLPLTPEILGDPTHSVVKVLLWCYTSSGFVFQVLN